MRVVSSDPLATCYGMCDLLGLLLCRSSEFKSVEFRILLARPIAAAKGHLCFRSSQIRIVEDQDTSGSSFSATFSIFVAILVDDYVKDYAAVTATDYVGCFNR